MLYLFVIINNKTKIVFSDKDKFFFVTLSTVARICIFKNDHKSIGNILIQL